MSRSDAPSRPADLTDHGARLGAAAGWRPMAYGRGNPYKIDDPLVEPLWGGRRVLVEVTPGAVVLRGTDGDEVDGYDDLRAAVADATFADDLIVDGSLMPAPLRDTEGARVRIGMDSVQSPGRRMRHMFIGETAVARKRRDLELADERRAPAPGDEPAAFVAIDLLWIDGQSLLDVPLQERKRILGSALDERELVRRTVTVRPPVEMWFAQWRALGFEEITWKSANGRYRPGTVSADWTIQLMPRR